MGELARLSAPVSLLRSGPARITPLFLRLRLETVDDEAISSGIPQALRAAVERLSEADARDEALAEFVPRRRVLLVAREASFIPLGRVWRLGVFLLDRQGRMLETGSTTRAVAPGYPGYQSRSTEERRGYRAAAHRGSFLPGETVNFGATPLNLDPSALRDGCGPLFIADGRLLVRWNPSVTASTAIDFPGYLNERVDLLIHPPAGA